MELDNNNHSVFLLYYHLVLVVKYRRKVFSDRMSQYAKDILSALARHTTLRWRNGITTKIMCISCFVLILI